MFMSTAGTQKPNISAEYMFESQGSFVDTRIRLTLSLLTSLHLTVDEAKTMLFALECALKDAYENEMALEMEKMA